MAIRGDTSDTLTLWRPVGPKELELIQQSGMRAFPPRLPDQPIFYPVLTEDYAIKIARDWNVPASGSGFVTRFEVARSFIAKYDVSGSRRARPPGVLDSGRGPRCLQRRDRRNAFAVVPQLPLALTMADPA